MASSCHKNIRRFITAQNQGSPSVYSRAINELRSGKKTTHWIWFVLPQLAALGRSSMAIRYGIQNIDEALAYLHEPILRERLDEVIDILTVQAGNVEELETLMGTHIDMVKSISSLTLFSSAGLVSAKRLLTVLGTSCRATEELLSQRLG